MRNFLHRSNPLFIGKGISTLLIAVAAVLAIAGLYLVAIPYSSGKVFLPRRGDLAFSFLSSL